MAELTLSAGDSTMAHIGNGSGLVGGFKANTYGTTSAAPSPPSAPSSNAIGQCRTGTALFVDSGVVTCGFLR